MQCNEAMYRNTKVPKDKISAHVLVPINNWGKTRVGPANLYVHQKIWQLYQRWPAKLTEKQHHGLNEVLFPNDQCLLYNRSQHFCFIGDCFVYPQGLRVSIQWLWVVAVIVQFFYYHLLFSHWNCALECRGLCVPGTSSLIWMTPSPLDKLFQKMEP